MPSPPTDVPEIRPVRSHAELMEAFQVRIRVFVEEQSGPEEEPDAWDWGARHVIVLWEGRVVGTARLYQPRFGAGRIGRVALLPEARGRGWGALLLQAVVRDARALGLREVDLHAQVSAAGFYARFGFQPVGDTFMEAGILHQRMRLPLVAAPPAGAETETDG